MRKLTLIFLFALVILTINSQVSSGETFAPVEMYISGGSNGQLKIDNPSGSSVESLTIADGETGQGTFQELGRWTTSSLKSEFNISGEWSAKAWVSSENRDATVNIRYTLIQNEESIEQLEFTGDVNYGESAELTGSSDFSLSSFDDSPLTLLIESSWSGRGAPPPPTEGNTSINFNFGSSTRDTMVSLPISHLQIKGGDEPSSVTGQSAYFVYVEIHDAFGVDDVLSLDSSDYSLKMGPEGETPWAASVDKVSKKSDFVEVKFLWSYEGKSLPAGENPYFLEIDARDMLSDLDWSKNLQTSIYIEPEPDVEINPITSTSKTVESGKVAVYTLSVDNTGSGSDEFIVTYDNNDGWDVSIDVLDFDLEPGDSQNIKVSITPPDTASDGEESPTEITVTADSDSDVKDSVTLVTTAREPEPNWDFSIIINKDASPSYDYSSDSFVIKDRASIEISFSIVNEGNDNNNFNLNANSVESAFIMSFDRTVVSSLSPNLMEAVTLTLTPREDYFGTNTFIELEVTSSADSKKETNTLEIFLEQSGNIIGSPNPQIKLSAGNNAKHTLSISNTDVNEAKRIYFGVSGKEPSDKLAETWLIFSDKNGNGISYGSFLTLLPAQSVEITITISAPSSAGIGSYDMNIWIYNEQNAQISSQYSIQIVTTQPAEEEESSMLLYGALLLALGGVLVYGYRNFYVDDGYEDEYEDFDELEDIPEILAEEPVPEVAPVAPVMAPPVEVTQAPEAVPVSPVPEVAPSLAKTEELVKPKKKWFGLFGGGDSKTSEQVVEPAVAQPVAAEPVVAQPVAAEPVVAQPVAAEPVVAQPVAAEPVVAEAVVAKPVEEEK